MTRERAEVQWTMMRSSDQIDRLVSWSRFGDGRCVARLFVCPIDGMGTERTAEELDAAMRQLDEMCRRGDVIDLVVESNSPGLVGCQRIGTESGRLVERPVGLTEAASAVTSGQSLHDLAHALCMLVAGRWRGAWMPWRDCGQPQGIEIRDWGSVEDVPVAVFRAGQAAEA